MKQDFSAQPITDDLALINESKSLIYRGNDNPIHPLYVDNGENAPAQPSETKKHVKITVVYTQESGLGTVYYFFTVKEPMMTKLCTIPAMHDSGDCPPSEDYIIASNDDGNITEDTSTDADATTTTTALDGSITVTETIVEGGVEIQRQTITQLDGFEVTIEKKDDGTGTYLDSDGVTGEITKTETNDDESVIGTYELDNGESGERTVYNDTRETGTWQNSSDGSSGEWSVDADGTQTDIYNDGQGYSEERKVDAEGNVIESTETWTGEDDSSGRWSVDAEGTETNTYNDGQGYFDTRIIQADGTGTYEDSNNVTAIITITENSDGSETEILDGFSENSLKTSIKTTTRQVDGAEIREGETVYRNGSSDKWSVDAEGTQTNIHEDGQGYRDEGKIDADGNEEGTWEDTDGNSGRWSVKVDADGNEEGTWEDTDGNSGTYKYDADWNHIESTVTWKNADGSSGSEKYDADWNLIERTVTVTNRDSEGNVINKTRTTYDPDGKIINTTITTCAPGGACTTIDED